MNSQIISRKRVAERGEVFTSQREVNAIRGARSLSGNWQMPITYVFSTEKIISLSRYENTIDGGFRYGPFGLVTKTSTNLYLVAWKAGAYFRERPTLYVLPNTPEQSLDLSQPTPVPLPSATATTAPTPLPIVTVATIPIGLPSKTPTP